MEVIFLPTALKDLNYWKQSGNPIIQKRIKQLLDAIQQNPFKGIGKPEPLRHSLSGKWSMRINAEHRIVYEIEDNVVIVYSLRYHYQ